MNEIKTKIGLFDYTKILIKNFIKGFSAILIFLFITSWLWVFLFLAIDFILYFLTGKGELYQWFNSDELAKIFIFAYFVLVIIIGIIFTLKLILNDVKKLKENKVKIAKEKKNSHIFEMIFEFKKNILNDAGNQNLAKAFEQNAIEKLEEFAMYDDEKIKFGLNEIFEANQKKIKEEEEIQKKIEEKQKAKGLEFYKGQWLPPQEIKRIKEIEIGLSNNFQNYSAFEFEEFIAKLFIGIGYEAKVTSKTGDYGIDVIAKKGKEIIAIQAKKYGEGNNVGNRDVQRLLGAMKLKSVRATHGILITTSYFTLQAKEQAKETDVELWDKNWLHEMVKKYFIK